MLLGVVVVVVNQTMPCYRHFVHVCHATLCPMQSAFIGCLCFKNDKIYFRGAKSLENLSFGEIVRMLSPLCPSSIQQQVFNLYARQSFKFLLPAPRSSMFSFGNCINNMNTYVKKSSLSIVVSARKQRVNRYKK